MASRTLTVVSATLLAVMIAISTGLLFFTSNYATAQMTGNMTHGMMRPGGMMGMSAGMMNGNQQYHDDANVGSRPERYRVD